MKRLFVSLVLAACSLYAHAVNYVGITQAPFVTVTVNCPATIPSCGTVTSSPAGINCPGTCSFAFTSTSTVTLTTTPNSSTASSTVHGTGTSAVGNWVGTGSASTCNSTATTSSCAFTFSTATTAVVSFMPKDSDVWYVAKTGADTVNDCRTLATACLTINHGMSLMSAGDTLYVYDGTYFESLGGANGNDSNLNVVSGTAVKTTRYFGYNPNQSIVDAGYKSTTPNALQIWKTSNFEVAYFKFLHGACVAEGDSQESSGTNAVLTPSWSGGGLASVAVTSGGTGFSAGSSWLAAIYGGTGSGAMATIHTNGSGNISSVDTIVPGSGYGSGSGVEIYPNIRVSNVYFHDFGCGQTSTAGGGANAVALFSVNNGTIENVWTWGYGARYGIAEYHCAHCRVRRSVARYDGSNTSQNNPRAAIVEYSVDDSLVENSISIDFDNGIDGSGTGQHYSFFTTASVTLPGGYPFGLGSYGWYGNMAVNGLNNIYGHIAFDSLASTTSGQASGGPTATATIVNNDFGPYIGQPASNAIQTWIEGDTTASINGGHHSVTFDHNVIYDQFDAASAARLMRFDSTGQVIASMQNNILVSPNFATTACFQNTGGTVTTSAVNQHNTCDDTRYTATPGGSAVNPYNLTAKYLLQCTATANCAGVGSDGKDVGPTIVNQYVNGTLTGAALWPFPNETEIRNDFCKTSDGFTTAQETTAGISLTVATGSNPMINGDAYYITTAGTSVNWTSMGATSGTVGTRFVYNNVAPSGSGGAVGPDVYTRNHNLTYFCSTSNSLTQYVWQQLGSPSPY